MDREAESLLLDHKNCKKKLRLSMIVAFFGGIIIGIIILQLIYSIQIWGILDHLRIDNLVISLNETKMVEYAMERMIEINGTYT